ncbi:MAG: TIGR01212 family radical SAM protein, partial [Deltaproteobacteria bacterium]|nr:TIGR01212 family radical SAM protein [Deltaproteobacteria bacterium]
MPSPTPVGKPAFWNNKKRYYDLKSYWINRFGCQVHKLPIDAGFTCPNRDGSIAAGGCVYCDGRGSALRQAGPLPSVGDQVRRGKAFYQKRPKAEKFIAYFQTFTNTYAPVENLRALYDEALAVDDVIGLSIGTRPDCVPDETLALIRSYAERSHVWLEFGLQSIHDRTLGAINRGHDA